MRTSVNTVGFLNNVLKTNTNVKWNSACWERKEKSEKPATAGLEPRVSD